MHRCFPNSQVSAVLLSFGALSHGGVIGSKVNSEKSVGLYWTLSVRNYIYSTQSLDEKLCEQDYINRSAATQNNNNREMIIIFITK